MARELHLAQRDTRLRPRTGLKQLSQRLVQSLPAWHRKSLLGQMPAHQVPCSRRREFSQSGNAQVALLQRVYCVDLGNLNCQVNQIAEVALARIQVRR
jgi:hypothetical protein